MKDNESNKNDNLAYRVGDRIGGDYLIKDIFGGFQKSGMGVVYLVENRRWDCPFVLKTYQDARANTNFEQKFRKEAEAWVAVGVHPNIVKAHWVDSIDFRLFVAAEYIAKDSEGRNNLHDYISAGPLNPFWILNWAAQFCYGMKYALRNGMRSHRDIKPENIMVDSDWVLKVTDFGLAKLSSANLVTSGGTLPYMSPEQIITPLKVDHRADIYAFGIIMYGMFTGGRYPYAMPTDSKDPQAEFIKAHLHGSPQKIDTPLYQMIERCLRKDPQARYAGYDELLGEIQKVAADMGFKLLPEKGPSEDDLAVELYARAQSLNSLGRHDEALKLIEEYTDKYPEASCGWTEKGRILLELNRSEDAEQALLKSVELFPCGSPVWNNLGILYDRLKRYEEAFVAYARALEFDVGNTGAYMNLALAYFNAGQYSKSADLYVRTIVKFPQKETLVFNAGNSAVLMMKEGAVNDAISILKVLTERRPKVVNHWHNLALCYWQLKQREDAADCFNKVVELNPSDDFAWISLVKLSTNVGNSIAALRYCDRLMELEKGLSKGATMKAQLLANEGKYSDATACLKRALEKFPEDDSVYFIWATIAQQTGKTSEAMEAARNCKKILVSQSPVNTENLEMIEAFIRRVEKRN
ncbi:MAG: tetratricopeptide repeat protein [Desulfobacterales bacterium]|nr:tetratricopeptide repeat protein [Desulfobacterales bacterium]